MIIHQDSYSEIQDIVLALTNMFFNTNRKIMFSV